MHTITPHYYRASSCPRRPRWSLAAGLAFPSVCLSFHPSTQAPKLSPDPARYKTTKQYSRALLPHSNTSVKMVKAVVAGAAGGIGQPLSLLLKLSPLVDELALYDVHQSQVQGVSVDLSHISSPAKITGYDNTGDSLDGAKAAMKDAGIIVIPAGVPRKPGMTRDDLFKINAGIVKGLIEVAAEVAPKAFILVISNPVNSTVPIAAETLKAKGVFDAKKLFGVTTLDVVRSETFVSEITGIKTSDLNIPVVGGHSGETIVPLFSKATPKVDIPDDKYAALVNRIQYGGDEVVKAKEGKGPGGSATLSMALAGFRFAEKVLKAAKGEKGLVEPSYVYLPGVPGGDVVKEANGGLDFFSVPVELGPNGVEKVTNPLTDLTDKESSLLKECLKKLPKNIEDGVDFVKAPAQKL